MKKSQKLGTNILFHKYLNSFIKLIAYEYSVIKAEEIAYNRYQIQSDILFENVGRLILVVNGEISG